MDRKKISDILKNITKEKLILMAAAGAVLILCAIPGENKSAKEEQVQKTGIENSDSKESYEAQIEKRLTKLLEEMEGVEKVHVMVILKSGESKEILKDETISTQNTNETDKSGGERTIHSYDRDETTIYIKDSDGNEIPYVLAENCPRIEGVAVVAQGADSPVIKEKIIQLIKALFGLEINKIMVTV